MLNSSSDSIVTVRNPIINEIMSDLATVAVELILTENLSSGAGTYSCIATNAAD